MHGFKSQLLLLINSRGFVIIGLTFNQKRCSLGIPKIFEGIISMPVEVKIRKGEPMERALRRLKKKLDREGVIRDVRAKRYFEKPSEIKRRKKKVAAFSNMLRVRYENS